MIKLPLTISSIPYTNTWLSSLILACSLLSACDGGIFGTGDGEPPIVDVESPIIGEPLPPVTDPGMDEIRDPLDDEFSNDTSTTLRDDALIRLVHASTGLADSIVITDGGNTDQPLVPLPGLSYSDAQTTYIPVNPAVVHDLDIFLSENFREDNGDKFSGINPMSLSPGTSTTIIARGTDEFDNTAPEILILTNIANSGGPNGMFRVINTASHFSQNGAVDIYILPEGTDVSGEPEPTSNNPLSYTAYDTGYIVLTPGRYELTATNVGTDQIRIPTYFPVELVAGQVLTFVIRDNPLGTPGQDVEILIVQDSTLPSD